MSHEDEKKMYEAVLNMDTFNGESFVLFFDDKTQNVEYQTIRYTARDWEEAIERLGGIEEFEKNIISLKEVEEYTL
jgi:hypothetical protein